MQRIVNLAKKYSGDHNIDNTSIIYVEAAVNAKMNLDGWISLFFNDGNCLFLKYENGAYKNEKYLYFGRFPARMDDVFNYIPSRITALLMTAAAFLTGMDGKNAWKIYLRDRRKHSSPNAAQTEAVCAGALRVRLAGDAVYFGKLYKKEYLGDSLRPVEPEDIRRAGKLMYVTAALVLVLFGAAKAAVIFAL